MLKTLWLAPFAVCALFLDSAPAAAQFAAPTRTAVAPTPAQDEAVRAGVELHDKKEYDAAIAKYQEVLKENADNVTALFEMAYSYLEKKDHAKSLDAARRGTEYQSDLLPMFYDVIASNYEAQGNLKQAVDTYKQAIAVHPKRGALYYNLAITYRESLKDPKTARQTLKDGARVDPQYAAIPVLLGQWFEAEGYRTQAFLALTTVMAIEPSMQAYALWRRVLKGPENPMAKGVMQDPDMRRSATQNMKPQPAKLDEGDFAAVDAQFAPTFQGMLDSMDDGTPEVEALVAQVDVLFDAILKQPANPKAPSFVGQLYVPFIGALKQKGYVEPFVYWATQRAPVPGVREWLKANEPRVREFREWAVAYPFPAVTPAPARGTTGK